MNQTTLSPLVARNGVRRLGSREAAAACACGAAALSVIVADDDPEALAFYEESLPAFGHKVCVARSGPRLVEQCRLLRPDLVISEILLPGMDGIAAADEVCRERPVPFVLVSRSYEPLWVARALSNDCVVACLPKPIDAPSLGAALAVAVRRFERAETLRAEAEAARLALEDRKLVERAKGALMRYVGVDEEEAYRRLRKLASEGNKKLCEVAREVIASAEVFRSLEQADAGKAGGNGRQGADGGHAAGRRRD